jgi:hypothetical protein
MLKTHITLKNMLRFLLLLIFSSRIICGYFKIWFFWLPFTWFISPPAYMFTLPPNTTVNTEYSIINKNPKTSPLNLLKMNSSSFLYENQISAQLIYILLITPENNFIHIKAQNAFSKLMCKILDSHDNNSSLVIKNFERKIAQVGIACEN